MLVKPRIIAKPSRCFLVLLSASLEKFENKLVVDSRFFRDKLLLFTDEVGFQFSLGTSRGRSKKGEKCQIVGPCLRCKNIPVMAGLTDSTILHFNVFENNGNALAYAHFSDDAAGARDDANLPENSIIVMDNLPFHRHARVIEMMQIRGWEWRFLPPYSPSLNPIECLFSQWKNHVKRSEPEDLEELDAATREVINVVTADH